MSDGNLFDDIPVDIAGQTVELWRAVRAADRFVVAGMADTAVAHLQKAKSIADVICRCLGPDPEMTRWQRWKARYAEVKNTMSDMQGMAILGAVLGGVFGGLAGVAYGVFSDQTDIWARWALYGAGWIAALMSLQAITTRASVRDTDRKEREARAEAKNLCGWIQVWVRDLTKSMNDGTSTLNLTFSQLDNIEERIDQLRVLTRQWGWRLRERKEV